MAAPVVASTVPANGDSDFDGKRDSLVAVFAAALDADSVTRSTVHLFETTSGHLVDKDVTISTDLKTVTVIPKSPLRENTNYTWSLVGSDINLPGGFIKSSGGDPLVTTYTVEFRTQEERYATLPEVLDRTARERVGPIREVVEDDTPTGYIVPTEYIPAAMSANQSRLLSTIEVDFGEAVSLTGSTPALSLVMSPSNGYTRDYGHEDANGKFLVRDVEGGAAGSDNAVREALIRDPVGSVTASSTSLVWTRDSGYEFPYNAEIMVQVHADRVTNGDGHQLDEDRYFFFTTEYWPVYATPTVLRIVLGSAISDVYDDTLYRIIFQNSIDAILHSGDNLGPSATRDYVWGNVERYVKAASLLDVVAHLRYLSEMQAGQKKQLGDFVVQYTASDPRLSLVVQKATADKERALRELRRYRGYGGPRSRVRSEDSMRSRADLRTRTWDSIVASALPTANTAVDRAAKSDLRTDHQQLAKRAARVVISADQEIAVDRDTGSSVIRW
jgi:hypothetical protein